LYELVVLRLGEGNPAQGAAQIATGVFKDRGTTGYAGIGESLQARGDGQLRETIQSACSPRLQIGAQVELGVVDLGCQRRAKRRRIEASERADRRLSA
jgi:hypothetical protein